MTNDKQTSSNNLDKQIEKLTQKQIKDEVETIINGGTYTPSVKGMTLQELEGILDHASNIKRFTDSGRVPPLIAKSLVKLDFEFPSGASGSLVQHRGSYVYVPEIVNGVTAENPSDSL